MTHAAPPIALYAQIAASHVAAPSAAAPAPARLPLVDVSGGAAGPSFSGGGGGLSEQSSTRSGTLASPLAEDSRMSRGSVRDFTTSIGDYKWKVRQEDIDYHTRLGAGAYGEVWAGTWRRNEVAVKSLLHGTLSEAHTANFVREMELLSELRHANIVRFMGACLDEERMCILFELCPGSLYDLLHKSEDPLPDPPILVKLMREVALGIYYLHAFDPPVLHLDLKSANVLLDENGSAKVCDFGLSHVMEDAAVESGSSMGSPQWTAPEILRGQSYDQKADTYSYGVLLYEVMSRTVPYSGRDQCELVVGVITKLLPRPELTADQAAPWPPRLPELMLRCYAEEPADRPDFAGVLDELDRLVPKERKMTTFMPTAGLFDGSPRAALGSARDLYQIAEGSPRRGIQSEYSASSYGSGRSAFGSGRLDPDGGRPRAVTDGSGTPLSARAAHRHAGGGVQLRQSIDLDSAERITAAMGGVGAAWARGESIDDLSAFKTKPRAASAEAGGSGYDDEVSLEASLISRQKEALGKRMLEPQKLKLRVPQVEKGKDGKPLFVIEVEIDELRWTVLRRERDVEELHTALTSLMRFVPDCPVAERRWWHGSLQDGALATKVQAYLAELTANGQWVWDENAVLRQFLQIPSFAAEKREARELVLNDIRSGKQRGARKGVLDDIRKGVGARILERGASSGVGVAHFQAEEIVTESAPPRHGISMHEHMVRQKSSFQSVGRPGSPRRSDNE